MIDFLPGIRSTSSALQAERIRMDIIAQNIAHANTTRDVNGKTYQRQHVIFETVLNEQQKAGFSGAGLQSVRVARIEKDHRPQRLVYDPGHPDSDPSGMVAMPNVSIHEEMADLIVSSRAYEANLAVARSARSLATQTLSIGRR
jgi:flagellar basal-body rod protein FlgC